MRVRGPAEQAESIETKRFKKSRGPLLSAREAGPRTELPADETLERGDRESLRVHPLILDAYDKRRVVYSLLDSCYLFDDLSS